MNYIKHLTGFFERVTQDKTLNPTHVSLYIALFQFWNCNRFKNPISISRDEVMRISKISSKATYHKCLKHLHTLGYIKYEPSYNPFRGSHVIMFNFAADLKPQPKTSSKNEPSFESVSEQVVNKQDTGNEQAIASYINNTNNLKLVNNLNLEEREQIENNENNASLRFTKEASQEKKWREKKKGFTEPGLADIRTFFQENNYPEIEAQKFYNYFSSIGWLVGGKTQMINWEAAANNWMLNTEKINVQPIKNNNQHLNTTTEKNYAEPL